MGGGGEEYSKKKANAVKSERDVHCRFLYNYLNGPAHKR